MKLFLAGCEAGERHRGRRGDGQQKGHPESGATGQATDLEYIESKPAGNDQETKKGGAKYRRDDTVNDL